MFTRTDGVWTEQAKLTTNKAFTADNMFGWSVAIDGDTAAVGALGDFSNGVDSGAAYVFTRANGVWTEQAKLTASDAFTADNFGRSVALSGNLLAVGSPGNTNKGADTGAAYVFARSDGAWSEQANLTATGAAVNHKLANSVSLSDNDLVEGAPGDFQKGTDTGAIHVFAAQIQ